MRFSRRTRGQFDGIARRGLCSRPVKSSRRAVEHQPAFVDEDHAVAHRLDFLQDVGREQDRLGLADAADRLADLADLVRVEAGGRLVHDQHVRLVQQHLGHADALAEALRELADRLADHAAELAQVDDRVHPLVDLLAASCRGPSPKNFSRLRGVMSG